MTLKAVRRITAGLAWLLAALAAAAPEDDFQRARAAYSRGDVVAAMAALRPAAESGHAPSMTMLAFILDRADFDTEAARWYREAAGRGDTEGHAGLANLLLTGRGVAKDEKAALAHFSKAAEAGHEASIVLLADAWLGGPLAPSLPADAAAGRAALERAALRNHLPAIDALAQAFREGGRFGVSADAQQAAAWSARAAELRKLRATPAPKAGR